MPGSSDFLITADHFFLGDLIGKVTEVMVKLPELHLVAEVFHIRALAQGWQDQGAQFLMQDVPKLDSVGFFFHLVLRNIIPAFGQSPC